MIGTCCSCATTPKWQPQRATKNCDSVEQQQITGAIKSHARLGVCCRRGKNNSARPHQASYQYQHQSHLIADLASIRRVRRVYEYAP